MLTLPDGEIYCGISMDKSGENARMSVGYTFDGDDPHKIGNYYLLASFIIRQRINLIGVRGGHDAVLDEALQADNLPDIIGDEGRGVGLTLQWEATDRWHSPKSGKVDFMPLQSPEALRLLKSEGTFTSKHTIALLDDEYLANLRRSPFGPYIDALNEIPRAICTVELHIDGFGFRSRHVPKYVAAAVSHLWVTLLASDYGNEEFFGIMMDIAEMSRLVELGPPESASALQSFTSGLIVDHCLAQSASM